MNHPKTAYRAISVGRSGSIVIRNRSQTEIVSVERKRVSYRSSSEKPTHMLNSPHKPIPVTAPTLLSSYRNRAASTTYSKPTVIYIKSQ